MRRSLLPSHHAHGRRGGGGGGGIPIRWRPIVFVLTMLLVLLLVILFLWTSLQYARSVTRRSHHHDNLGDGEDSLPWMMTLRAEDAMLKGASNAAGAQQEERVDVPSSQKVTEERQGVERQKVDGAAQQQWVDKQDERSSTTTRLKGDAYKFFHLPRYFKCTRLDARGGMQADVRRTFEQHVERREPVILQLGDALFDASNGFRWRKWMKADDARQPDLAYLEQTVGADAVVMSKRAPFGGETWSLSRADRKRFFPQRFGDFVRDLDPSNSTGGALYLGIQGKQASLTGAWYQHPPLSALKDDFDFPPFMQEALQKIDEGCEVNGDGSISREEFACTLWMGNPRVPSISGTHFDAFHNLYVVLSGHKSFRIHSPNDAFFLHRDGVVGTVEDHGKPQTNFERQRRPIGNFASYADLALSGKDENATMWYNRANHGLCDVAAGEALFLPAYFFHRVTTSGLTIAVNFWANQHPKCTGPMHWDHTLQACVRDLTKWLLERLKETPSRRKTSS